MFSMRRANRAQQFEEIHQYVADIAEMQQVRDNAATEAETAQFDETLKIMNKVLLHLNQRVADV